MKTSLMILLMILFNSCQKFPELKNPITRCGMFITRLGENTYSGKCRCHEYQINFQSGIFRRVSDSKDFPLDQCHKYISMSPDDWGALRSEFQDIHTWLQDAKKKLKKVSE